MFAALVYSGGPGVLIPDAMGSPTPDQMKGTPLDQLGELASRVCYESLGFYPDGKPRGRPSAQLHAHIKEVKNHSVYEHCNLTVGFDAEEGVCNALTLSCVNRKGMWVERPSLTNVEITTNLRALLEWRRHNCKANHTWYAMSLEPVLRAYAHRLAPMIVPPTDATGDLWQRSYLKTEGLTADQAWVTLYLSSSRGFCYTPDTEVLTREGWMPVGDLRDSDIILTKDPQTGKARWSPNKKQHTYHYAGRVYWLESSQWVSPAVTRDHLMWAARYDLRNRRAMSCEDMMDRFPEKIVMERLSGKKFVVDHRIEMAETLDPQTITVDGFPYDAELLFVWLGWMATDGCMHDRRCKIYQMKAWNFPAIRALLTALFSNRWGEHSDYFEVNDSEALADWAIKMIGPSGENRDLRALYAYSPRLLGAFIEAAIQGDGNSNWNVNGSGFHDVIYVGYEHAAKQYQVILGLLGRSCNIREDDRVGQVRELKTGKILENKRIKFVVSLHNKGVSIVKKGHHRCRYYVGPVYCPQTDDGIIFVRREGMAFWCCNSHEQVRHRFAMSQRSTRYVDEDGSPYVEHPLVTKFLADESVDHAYRAGMAELIAKSVEADRKTYRGLVSALQAYLKGRGADALTARKQARGAARGYLGNALQTEMIYSAPVSGWLWILSQRANKLADAEIRGVYQPGLRALKMSDHGHFFGHLELVPSPDGLGEVLAA